MKKIIVFNLAVVVGLLNYAAHRYASSGINKTKSIKNISSVKGEKKEQHPPLWGANSKSQRSINNSPVGFNPAQQNISSAFSLYFEEAYQTYPNIPRGVLEAISYTTTRINHIDSTTPESCMGMPRVYGVMGLMLDGKGHFRNNLLTVAELSGISKEKIINDAKWNILAYAATYSILKNRLKIKDNRIESEVQIVKYLSEIPNDTIQSDFPLNAHVYSVLKFLTNNSFQKQYHFPPYKIDFLEVFGEDNFRVLSAGKVIRYQNTYKSEDGTIYINNYKK